MLLLQEKDGHLRPRERAIRTIGGGSAPNGDPLVKDCFHRQIELVGGRHISEAAPDVQRPAFGVTAAKGLIRERVPVRRWSCGGIGNRKLVTVSSGRVAIRSDSRGD